MQLRVHNQRDSPNTFKVGTVTEHPYTQDRKGDGVTFGSV